MSSNKFDVPERGQGMSTAALPKCSRCRLRTVMGEVWDLCRECFDALEGEERADFLARQGPRQPFRPRIPVEFDRDLALDAIAKKRKADEIDKKLDALYERSAAVRKFLALREKGKRLREEADFAEGTLARLALGSIKS